LCAERKKARRTSTLTKEGLIQLMAELAA
jgi:hypothetical protein